MTRDEKESLDEFGVWEQEVPGVRRELGLDPRLEDVLEKSIDEVSIRREMLRLIREARQDEAIRQPVIFKKHATGIGPSSMVSPGKLTHDEAFAAFPEAVQALVKDLRTQRPSVFEDLRYPRDVLEVSEAIFYLSGKTGILHASFPHDSVFRNVEWDPIVKEWFT